MLKRDGKGQKARKKVVEKKEKAKPNKKKGFDWDSEEEFEPETNTEDKVALPKAKKTKEPIKIPK